MPQDDITKEIAQGPEVPVLSGILSTKQPPEVILARATATALTDFGLSADAIKPLQGSSEDDFLTIDSFFGLVNITDVGTPANDVVNGAINDSVSVTSAAKVIVGSDGILKTRSANTLETSHNPTTLAKDGVLLETAATNFVLQSAAADNASWTKTNTDVPTTNNTDPFNTTTADEWAATSTGSVVRTIDQSFTGLTAAQMTTVSRWFKVGTNVTVVQLVWDADGNGTDGCYCNFDISAGTRKEPIAFAAGTATSARILAHPNGWYRCELTGSIASGTVGQFSMNMVANTSAVGFATASLTNNDSVRLFGAQGEAGADIASSYIATTTIAVTRAADSAATIPLADFPYVNTASGAVGVRYRLLESVGGDSLIMSIGNSATEIIAIEQFDTSGSQHRGSIVDGGVQQALLANGPGWEWYYANTLTLLGWSVNDVEITGSHGMDELTAVNTATMPTTAGTLLYLGGDSTGVGASIMLKEFSYISRKPNSPELKDTARLGLPFPAHDALPAGTATASVSVGAGANATIDTGFAPADWANLTNHWDASNAGSITATSNNVDQWDDLKGTINFTQTGSIRPRTGENTINGLNVIFFFDTGPDHMDAVYSHPQGDFYVGMVFDSDVRTNVADAVFCYVSDTSNFDYQFDAGHVLEFHGRLNPRSICSEFTLSGGHFPQVEYWEIIGDATANTLTCYVGGVQFGQATDYGTDVDGPGILRLGASRDLAQHITVGWCELIIGDAIPSTADRAGLTNYINNKWGT